MKVDEKSYPNAIKMEKLITSYHIPQKNIRQQQLRSGKPKEELRYISAELKYVLKENKSKAIYLAS